jgi:Lon protease-like protein
VTTRLPLFPLGTVLVPGLVLPLHIFEPRYRRLIQDLSELPEAARLFGVIAVRSAAVATGQPAVDDLLDDRLDDTEDALEDALEEALEEVLEADLPHPEPPVLYSVGCSALIQEITTYEDGRSDVFAVGQERFRLLRLVPDAGTPYLVGEVELLDEPDGAADLSALAQLVGLRFAAYRERLRVEQSGVPTDPRVLSYLVSAAAVLELPQRQALLEAPSTHARLRAELALLRREIGLLDTFAAMPAVDLTRRPVAPN